MDKTNKRMLIVDDVTINRLLLNELFHEKYEVLEAENGLEAIKLIKQHDHEINVVLLDLLMPEVSGFEVLQFMNESHCIDYIPVVLITSESDDDSMLHAYRLGASDLIAKPFNSDMVIRRIENIVDLYSHKNHLEWEIQKQKKILINQDKRLKQINTFLVDTLSTAVEFRDGESGEHIKRIKFLTQFVMEMISELHNFSDDTIMTIANAAVLHDIGKIAIPDSILMKPGKLSEEEFEIMKTHTIRGCDILQSLNYIPDGEYYKYAYEICRYHHERWDGNGYPDRLKGDDIPIWAQAVSFADVYDALTSDRVYKKAYSHEQAVHMILSGECGIFHPLIIERLDKAAHQLPELIKMLHQNPPS